MNALREKILLRIEREGPITVAQYMEMALYDPEHGYYMKRDPFGAQGDFITAPEVSQMFGELIGLWFVQAWEDRGRHKRFNFVELGPGRGTLMADMLRAARIRPEFVDAAEVMLVETSPALRTIQQRNLDGARVRWCTKLADIPHDEPLFLIGNEFLDALPVRQFVKTGDGWHERMIGASGEKLVFTLDKKTVPEQFINAPDGTIFELSTAAKGIVGDIAARIAKSGGVALFIDYGHAQSALGDTLQAIKAHKYADPLAEPGEADLTTHVDFGVVAAVAREAKADVFGPIPQKDFLRRLGIVARAETLKKHADATSVEADVERLTGQKQMGNLFKVLAIAPAGSARLPAFE